MGDNLYTTYWQSALPKVIDQFKQGKQTIQLPVNELASFGDRQSYYANFRIDHGKIEIPRNAYAQGRDLFAVLSEDEYFKESLSDQVLQVTITKDLLLKIEILSPNSPDFFTEEDFTELSKFANETMDNANEEHKQTYEILKRTYNKVEYWAREVQKKQYPDGSISIRKRPTNQANNFEEYQWAKVYPNKNATETRILAFTVGLDTGERFQIKIDTVGLNEYDERRKKYLGVRGEYERSKIVKLLPYRDVIDKGWKYLVDLTVNIFIELKPSYDSLFADLTGTHASTADLIPQAAPQINLNTILYGPPGTGKTYQLNQYKEELFTDRDIAISSEELLKDRVSIYPFWKILAVVIAQSKNPVSVTDLLSNPLIKAKINPTAKTPRNTLWRILQSYADESSTEMDSKYKGPIQLFHKNEDSKWEIIHDKKTELPDIIEQELQNIAANPIPKPAQSVRLKTRFNFITFHQKYSYEDFIEGIKPLLRDKEIEDSVSDLQFELKKGIFYNSCLEALKLAGYESFEECYNDTAENRAVRFETIEGERAKQFALFIDEINRANISAVFGELITLLEDDKRMGAENEMWVELPYTNEKFCVPGNLYVIGTMNTADRSIALLDIALRRRFEFKALYPLYIESEWWAPLLEALNQAIHNWKKNPDFFIGHAFFINKPQTDRIRILNTKIIPLLYEYCQSNGETVKRILAEAGVPIKPTDIKNNFQIIAE